MLKKIFMRKSVRSLTMLMLASIFMLALITYNQSDPSFNLATASAPTNLLGILGSYLSDILYQTLGLASFILPIAFASWSYIIYKNGNLTWKLIKIPSLVLALVCACASLNELKINSLPANGGGVTGFALTQVATKFFSEFAQIMWLISMPLAAFFLIIALGFRFSAYIDFTQAMSAFVAKLTSWVRIPTIKLPTFSWKFKKTDNPQPTFVKTTVREPIISRNDPAIAAPPLQRPIAQVQPQTFSNQFQAPVASSSWNQEQDAADILPSVELLDDASDQHIQMQSPAELQQQAEEIISVLGDFGVKGKIIDIKQGPVVTMYEFEPAAGTKSSRVIGLSDDIARSLSAVSTRIANIPGRNALGIELPNKQRMFFRLKELIETPQFQDPDILLPIILGKDLGGQPLVADLAKMPHLLVAGTTGSGKSVAINTMIMSLLYRYTPAECRMVMIDPKMLELSAYDNIPHLMTPVVTEPGKAVVALKWAVKEMENRYRLMSHLGVRSIANFNAKILEATKEGKILERRMQTGFDPETGKPIFESVPIDMNKMPFIVVIVDEMADLMLVAGKDIETSIQRLAQMARAAGIHIIMATQRPSVDVITGVIKANFPSRISFKVTSKIDSRTILGEQGSEQLLGRGDMLYMGNSARILRVHGPFVDDKEVEKVTNFLRSTGVPEYVSAVTESEEDIFGDEFSDGDGDNDDVYKQAVNIVRNERKASISYIQRSLRIGYNRAANIVEEMEKNGILSSPNHSGKREVLLPED